MLLCVYDIVVVVTAAAAATVSTGIILMPLGTTKYGTPHHTMLRLASVKSKFMLDHHKATWLRCLSAQQVNGS